MTRRFFSGSTLDQAVMMAARHYEIEPAELEYRQIEKRHGFLRTPKAVMIAVDPERPSRALAAPASEDISAPAAAAPEAPAPQAEQAERAGPPDPPVADAEPADDDWAVDDIETFEEPRAKPAPEPADEAREDRDVEEEEAGWSATETPEADEADEAEQIVAVDESPASEPNADHDDELLGAAEDATQLLMRFAGIEAGASAKSGGERVEVEIDGPDATVLVVEDGKGLLAIQHLLPRLLRGLTGRSSFVRVDSQSFHRLRRERLEALAAKEAEVASRTGTPRTLPPMAPDERRIVHLALQEAPTVVTESRGTGLHKRVVIRPVSGDGGVDDIEARHGF